MQNAENYSLSQNRNPILPAPSKREPYKPSSLRKVATKLTEGVKPLLKGEVPDRAERYSNGTYVPRAVRVLYKLPQRLWRCSGDLSVCSRWSHPPLLSGEPIRAVPFRGKWQMHSICRKGLLECRVQNAERRINGADFGQRFFKASPERRGAR